MMSLRTPLLTLTLITLFMSLGVDGTEWSVKYNPTEICVLKGSTVFINGTFTYPKDHEVTDTFWVIDPVKDVESLDLYKRTEFSGRIHYLGDKQQNFSFRLSNVTNDDQHMYCFRVSVNTPVKTDKYLYYPGVQLHITELHVNTPPEVTEREAAVLNCTTTCSLTDSPTFIWYKNGRPLSSSRNPLHLQPVSIEDAGSYRCAVRGYEHLPSPAQTLTVRYPPKNVSISPSGEIVEGSSVTLTCSSDANPPVQNYTWFIEGGTSPVGSGQTYRIVNITAEHTGLYYCVAQNEHGALNGTVTISVKRGQSLSAVWSAVGGGAFFAVVVVGGVFICIYRNKKKRSETNHKETTQAAPSVSGAAADVQYATVTPSRSRPVQDDVQYATVRDLSDGVSSSDQQGEPLYATVTLQSYTAATGSPTQKMVEASVIYGTVKTD